MSAARWILAGLLAGALAGCRREVPHIEAGPPPEATLVPDPVPSPPAVADTPPPPPRPVVAPTGTGRRAGQHVRVEWHGKCYPARIVSVPRPGAYLITYDGYDHSWDETVGESRICK